jgi:hypothetical protein
VDKVEPQIVPQWHKAVFLLLLVVDQPVPRVLVVTAVADCGHIMVAVAVVRLTLTVVTVDAAGTLMVLTAQALSKTQVCQAVNHRVPVVVLRVQLEVGTEKAVAAPDLIPL